MNNLVEVKEFKHEVFGDLRTIYNESEDKVLFVGKDVASKLGYHSYQNMFRIIDEEDKIEINPQSELYQGLDLEPNPYVYRMILINERGVLSAIQSSDVSVSKKRDILKSLRLENYIILQSRAETEFGEQLILFMNRLGYTVELQYKALEYYIDFYIPELNIAIEYDEIGHKYQVEEDRQRELEIQEEIGCKFIRVEDGLNIGTQLGIIANEIYARA